MEEDQGRKKVVLACSNCRRLHKRCDESRPCRFCVKSNVAHTCKDWKPKAPEKAAAVAQADTAWIPRYDQPPPSVSFDLPSTPLLGVPMWTTPGATLPPTSAAAVAARQQHQHSDMHLPLPPASPMTPASSADQQHLPVSLLPFNGAVLRHMRTLQMANLRRNSAPELIGNRWSDFEIAAMGMFPPPSPAISTSSFLSGRRDSLSSGQLSPMGQHSWGAPPPAIQQHQRSTTTVPVIFVREESLVHTPQHHPIAAQQTPHNLFSTTTVLSLNTDSFQDDVDSDGDESTSTDSESEEQQRPKKARLGPSPTPAHLTPAPAAPVQQHQSGQSLTNFKTQNEMWDYVRGLGRASQVLVYDCHTQRPSFVSREFLRRTGLTMEQVHSDSNAIKPFVDAASVMVTVRGPSSCALFFDTIVPIPLFSTEGSDALHQHHHHQHVGCDGACCAQAVRVNVAVFTGDQCEPFFWVFCCHPQQQ